MSCSWTNDGQYSAVALYNGIISIRNKVTSTNLCIVVLVYQEIYKLQKMSCNFVFSCVLVLNAILRLTFSSQLTPPPSDPPSNVPWFFNRLWHYISSVLTYLLTLQARLGPWRYLKLNLWWLLMWDILLFMSPTQQSQGTERVNHCWENRKLIDRKQNNKKVVVIKNLNKVQESIQSIWFWHLMNFWVKSFDETLGDLS